MKYLLPVLLAALVAGCDPQARQAGDTGREDKGETAARGVPRSEPPPQGGPYLTPTAAAFSADGKRLLVGYDGLGGTRQPDQWTCLDLWDTATGQQLQTFTGHKQKVNFVAFLPDGKRAVSGSQDMTVRLWDLSSAKQSRSVRLKGEVFVRAILTPDGKVVVVGDGTHEVKLLDAENLHTIKSLPIAKGSLQSLAVSEDSRWALSGHASWPGQDAVAILWDLKTGEKARSFASADGWAQPGIVSPDGAAAFLRRWVGKLGVDQHQEVALVDLKTGKALRTFPMESGGPIAFLPGGKRFLRWGGAQTLAIYDLAAGKDVWSAEVEKAPAPISVITVSPDGKLLFTASGSYMVGGGDRASMKLWDAAKGELLQRIDREWPPR